MSKLQVIIIIIVVIMSVLGVFISKTIEESSRLRNIRFKEFCAQANAIPLKCDWDRYNSCMVKYKNSIINIGCNRDICWVR